MEDPTVYRDFQAILLTCFDLFIERIELYAGRPFDTYNSSMVRDSRLRLELEELGFSTEFLNEQLDELDACRYLERGFDGEPCYSLTPLGLRRVEVVASAQREVQAAVAEARNPSFSSRWLNRHIGTRCNNLQDRVQVSESQWASVWDKHSSILSSGVSADGLAFKKVEIDSILEGQGLKIRNRLKTHLRLGMRHDFQTLVSSVLTVLAVTSGLTGATSAGIAGLLGSLALKEVNKKIASKVEVAPSPALDIVAIEAGGKFDEDLASGAEPLQLPTRIEPMPDGYTPVRFRNTSIDAMGSGLI